MPEMSLINVVFPEPDGPMTASTLPDETDPEASRKIVFATARLPFNQPPLQMVVLHRSNVKVTAAREAGEEAIASLSGSIDCSDLQCRGRCAVAVSPRCVSTAAERRHLVTLFAVLTPVWL